MVHTWEDSLEKIHFALFNVHIIHIITWQKYENIFHEILKMCSCKCIQNCSVQKISLLQKPLQNVIFIKCESYHTY